jgi:citrate synthase
VTAASHSNSASASASRAEDEVAAWWATSLCRIEPGVIELRGHPVQELIGSTSLVSMIWLLLRGSPPSPRQASLLEAALVAGVDHGPQAPSIAAARMAATCGVGLNTAVATGVGMLGDVHGGAGEQCVQLLTEIRAAEQAGTGLAGPGLAGPELAGPALAGPELAGPAQAGTGLPAAVDQVLARWQARSRYIPGFGHRFHPVDPRRAPLLALVSDAAADGVVTGDYLRAAVAVETALNRDRDQGRRPVPMNIDGATAVIYAELGFPAPLARGLFVLSRSIGILAHAWEETGQGRRNKGPIPPSILPAYLGQPETP